jgi:hypothetical protein
MHSLLYVVFVCSLRSVVSTVTKTKFCFVRSRPHCALSATIRSVRFISFSSTTYAYGFLDSVLLLLLHSFCCLSEETRKYDIAKETDVC